jgi:hypothetical protein
MWRVASIPLAEHLLNKGKRVSERNLESCRANSRQLTVMFAVFPQDTP